MDELLMNKLFALFTVFILITVTVAAPIKVAGAFNRLGAKGQIIMSALMCFSGGVFLAAFLLHLLPEGKWALGDAFVNDKHIEFPVAEMMIGAGFFMVLFTEQILHRVTGHHEDDSSPLVRQLSTRGSRPVAGEGDSDAEDERLAIKAREAANGVTNGDARIQMTDSSKQVGGVSDGAAFSHGHAHNIDNTGQLTGKSIILIIALSMDCIFEGIACGLESSVGGVWKVVAAVMSHEFPIGFGLGLELVKRQTVPRHLILALVYGLTCPAGIAIGILITETGNEDSPAVDTVTATLLCVGGGVFLYVTFFQILQYEVTPNMKLYQMVALLLGFLLIATMVKVVPHSHAHDEEDDHGHEH